MSEQLRKAAKLAISTLDGVARGKYDGNATEAIEVLRAALAATQPSHGIVASDTFRVNMLRLAPSLSDDDINWLANIAVRSRLQPGQPRDSRVCHAPGDKCRGCDHCYGRADRCAYAPQPDQRLDANETDPTALWAEIHRLRVALRGPDGYASWQDAATDERMKRVRAEKALKEVTSAQPAQLEPVALRFPTMLRKMWSGGEVQAWLDSQGPLYAAPPSPQPQAEPVAWIQQDHLEKARVAPFLCRVEPIHRDDFVPIYAAPPQRVPMTDAEIDRVLQDAGNIPELPEDFKNCDYLIARAIEAHHGITGKKK